MLLPICRLLALICLFSNATTAQSIPFIEIRSKDAVLQVGKFFAHREGEGFELYNSNKASWQSPGKDAYWLSPDRKHWMYSEVKNASGRAHTYKLFINNVQAGICHLYIVRNAGIDSSQLTGSLVPLQQRASNDRLLSFIFELQPGETISLYISHFRKGIGITVTPEVYRLPAHPPVWPEYILIVVLTILLLISLASLFVMVYFPALEVFLFFLYVVTGILYVLAATGFGAMYVWTGFPALEENAAVFFGAASTSSLLLFSAVALKLKKQARILFYLCLLASIIYLASGVCGFMYYKGEMQLVAYKGFMVLPYLLTLFTFLFMLLYTLIKGIKRQRPLLWFTAIFFSFFCMAIFLTLLELGVLPFNFRTHPLILAFGALPQIILAFLFLLYKVLSMLKKHASALEKEKQLAAEVVLQERLRISEELHDEVGATLSGIAMYSHLAKEQLQQESKAAINGSLNIIQQNAGDMVNKLNDIVWLINPGNDNLQQLLQRLEDYAVQMAAVKNIRVKSNINGHHIKTILPAETRRNIYLLFKEAINNAVKYSQAGLFEFSVSEENSNIRLSFSDNGTGFLTSEVKMGNGLVNMANRAKEINAILQYSSIPAKGTSVHLILPQSGIDKSV